MHYSIALSGCALRHRVLWFCPVRMLPTGSRQSLQHRWRRRGIKANFHALSRVSNSSSHSSLIDAGSHRNYHRVLCGSVPVILSVGPGCSSTYLPGRDRTLIRLFASWSPPFYRSVMASQTPDAGNMSRGGSREDVRESQSNELNFCLRHLPFESCRNRA